MEILDNETIADGLVHLYCKIVKRLCFKVFIWSNCTTYFWPTNEHKAKVLCRICSQIVDNSDWMAPIMSHRMEQPVVHENVVDMVRLHGVQPFCA